MTSVPVLIVGCGPAGLLSSILLSRLEIEHIVIEARNTLHLLPQAHVLKLRTMEIIREFGLDEEVLSKATPTDFQQYVTWRDTLSSTPLGKISMQGRKGATDRFLTLSPTFPANMPQDEFERILFDYAKQSRVADFRFNHQCHGISQDADSVLAKVKTDGGEQTFRADYVIGADGVSSTVRKSLDISFEGDQSLQTFMAVVGNADLSELVKHDPGVLHWICSPSCKGVFIIHNVHRRFVFMLPYDSAVMSPEDLSETSARDLMRKALGAEIPFEVEAIGHWNMSAQVAESYGLGRVFLAGDAAHRFPPTGGMGLNTGAQDVNNLVWKIAACLRGQAGPGLLDTYETECRPVAIRNCGHSKNNYLRMDEVDAAIFGTAGFLSPERLAFLNSGSEEARTALEQIQAVVDSQLPHFDTTALDLGYRYVSAAVVPDPEGLPTADSEVHEFIPLCRSGLRLPHMRLEEGGKEISSLDLLDYRSFTLFCPAGSEFSRMFVEADDDGFGLNVVVIGEGGRYLDPHGDWSRLSGLGDRGAVLVRPDGQVCWRSPGATDDCTGTLRSVVSKVMSRDQQA